MGRSARAKNIYTIILTYFANKHKFISKMSESYAIYEIFLMWSVTYIKVHPCTGTEALYRPYGPYGNRDRALLFHDQRH